MSVEITPATAGDHEDWRRLWRAYCDFYNTVVSDRQTDLTWSRILDPDHTINCLIARDRTGRIAGFVNYLMHPSTWLDVGDCYLEDLYVDTDRRGGGAGRALIHAVRGEAERHGCERLYWTTNEDNERARALYDKIAGPADSLRYRIILR